MKLRSYIGSEKTLILSSSTFGIENFAEFQDKIFLHLVPGSRLVRYDPSHREILREHIEGKLCSQVIFVGSKDQKLVELIESDDSLHSLKSTLTFNLKPLLRDKHEKAIDPAIRMQMMIEFNVINQCKFLMDYFFIKEKVEKKRLQVKGVVTEIKTNQLKPIFRNGIVFNDLLTLN